MRPINTLEDIERELASLVQLDERLVRVADVAGEVPLRRRSADFAGLCNIVVAQLLSVAAAASIWARLEALVVPFEPDVLLSKSDEELLGVGLSNAKLRTLKAIAEELKAGLCLNEAVDWPGEVAHKRLCEIKGIGPWSADIFLLFCAGHPDVFPVGDVALQAAVQHAFDLEERPKGKVLAEITEAWSPHRGTAARLFWSYYRVMKEGRETLPV
ncbi:DNA-3-methyladenine glycosylase [Pseudovibrio sp. Ad46]|uniref:DNA-3-methyladenine glycosylase family protein n=1 Tax=unclassified Pseudovibrio TaxID=2627060 RepID=UPI0007AE39D7|nr:MULTISPECIES: DNA-3-methyladenine glycosylase [unclassified Pseudovibrio]KZK93697.1 DNA-3-methyladenine glycosylase [Pseudovibrio sp. W74]KZK96108.1 DNA-3-methyladenine glycosylase [Pseudovibrio sp. Ad46]KZL00838.1 DNA-3-methyladenine glycosylase [Pseudovibrio sp. Ad5]KZL12020.1 DNA-3-methyladenine glycosylase [Pseudovibrio sp. Ad14]